MRLKPQVGGGGYEITTSVGKQDGARGNEIWDNKGVTLIPDQNNTNNGITLRGQKSLNHAQIRGFMLPRGLFTVFRQAFVVKICLVHV